MLRIFFLIGIGISKKSYIKGLNKMVYGVLTNAIPYVHVIISKILFIYIITVYVSESVFTLKLNRLLLSTTSKWNVSNIIYLGYV